MKVLFATNNLAKVGYYKEQLNKAGIEVITLKDIDIKLEIKEDGKNAVENAMQKAEPYAEKTKMITIGIDDNLYIDGLEENEQPRTQVRRVNGKRLNDDEMIEYYTNITKKLGGTAHAHWVYGIAVCNNGKIKTFQKENPVIFTDTVSTKRIEGYPLDSITINPQFGCYHSELTTEQKRIRQETAYKEIVEFIIKSCKE